MRGGTETGMLAWREAGMHGGPVGEVTAQGSAAAAAGREEGGSDRSCSGRTSKGGVEQGKMNGRRPAGTLPPAGSGSCSATAAQGRCDLVGMASESRCRRP